uniref:BAX n=1 Tax=Botryllus schlosseri TaxID=30301 RepID=A0A165NNF9_BOTSH|nr:BAX [Botryllus schlosseri]
MSGGGDQAKKEAGKIDDKNDEDPRPSRPTRPRTARPGRRTDPESSLVQGAVGGEGSYTRHLTEEERAVGNQARHLLTMFISDRAERDPDLSQDKKGAVQETVQLCNKSSESNAMSDSDAALREVSLTLRVIGDQLNEDNDLNSLIDRVLVQPTKDIFMKVCKQIFADQNFNWGRVAAVFYFAYRLITKAVCTTMDEGIDWIKDIMSWAMDFLYQYVLWWIVQRGGWGMIREYFGTPTAYVVSLSAATILTVLYVWWKQQ